ncbi:MAG: TetR-like C-terminal domain-containing protein, partial [Pseudomonadota bacterium]
KNHFENLTALLSELAAIGFERFADQLTTAVSKATRPTERNRLSGLAYVTFARENPAMFELMFRSDKPDFANPRLQASSERALRGLAANNDVAFKNGELTALTADQGARMARTWALAHGLAMLMLDDQLTPILQRLPNDYEPDELFQTIFRISNV